MNLERLSRLKEVGLFFQEKPWEESFSKIPKSTWSLLFVALFTTREEPLKPTEKDFWEKVLAKISFWEGKLATQKEEGPTPTLPPNLEELLAQWEKARQEKGKTYLPKGFFEKFNQAALLNLEKIRQENLVKGNYEQEIKRLFEEAGNNLEAQFRLVAAHEGVSSLFADPEKLAALKKHLLDSWQRKDFKTLPKDALQKQILADLFKILAEANQKGSLGLSPQNLERFCQRLSPSLPPSVASSLFSAFQIEKLKELATTPEESRQNYEKLARVAHQDLEAAVEEALLPAKGVLRSPAEKEDLAQLKKNLYQALATQVFFKPALPRDAEPKTPGEIKAAFGQILTETFQNQPPKTKALAVSVGESLTKSLTPERVATFQAIPLSTYSFFLSPNASPLVRAGIAAQGKTFLSFLPPSAKLFLLGFSPQAVLKETEEFIQTAKLSADQAEKYRQFAQFLTLPLSQKPFLSRLTGFWGRLPWVWPLKIRAIKTLNFWLASLPSPSVLLSRGVNWVLNRLLGGLAVRLGIYKVIEGKLLFAPKFYLKMGLSKLLGVGRRFLGKIFRSLISALVVKLGLGALTGGVATVLSLLWDLRKPLKKLGKILLAAAGMALYYIWHLIQSAFLGFAFGSVLGFFLGGPIGAFLGGLGGAFLQFSLGIGFSPTPALAAPAGGTGLGLATQAATVAAIGGVGGTALLTAAIILIAATTPDYTQIGYPTPYGACSLTADTRGSNELKKLIIDAGGWAGAPPAVIAAIAEIEGPHIFDYTDEQILTYSAPGAKDPINCAPNGCGARGPMQFLNDGIATDCGDYTGKLMPDVWAKYANAVNEALPQENRIPEVCNIKDSIYAAALKIKTNSQTSKEETCLWSQEAVDNAARGYHGECSIKWERLGGRTYCEYVWEYYQDHNLYQPVLASGCFFWQKDPRWKDHGFSPDCNIGNSGCGPTSLAMVFCAFNIPADPPTIWDEFVAAGYLSADACLTQHAALETIPKKHGVESIPLGRDWDQTERYLTEGYLLIASTSLYSPAGHLLVVTKIEGDTVTTWDPALPNGEGKTYTREGLLLYGGFWALKKL